MSRVLIACERSGTVRDQFIKRGHNAISCDLHPSDKPGPHIQGDVLDILNDDWDLIVAHPVCTRLANSGVRWLHQPPRGKTVSQMWGELEQGIKFYRAFQDAPCKLKAIENPVMHKHAREALNISRRQIVQPWHFGDKAFKATGWELYGLPDLVPTDKLTPPKAGTDEHKQWSAIHRCPPGAERARIRSNFFPGMAAAIADQWGDYMNISPHATQGASGLRAGSLHQQSPGSPGRE